MDFMELDKGDLCVSITVLFLLEITLYGSL